MPVIVHCEWCNKQESVIPRRAKTYRFCSYKCRGEWRSRHWTGENSPFWQGGIRAKVCENCGEPYQIKDNQPITTFRKQRFCSHECGVEGRNTMGENNPNWKGGHSNRSYKQRVWAQAVISRDKATCQRCRAKGIELHAHHLRSFKEYPELRWDISNGETLCFRCHWDEHTASDANAVNSGKPLTVQAEGNPEPSPNGNIREGVTTRGRAYRRWEGSCGDCGKFISRQLSRIKNKNATFCDRVCRDRWQSRMKMGKPRSSQRYGSNASTSAARESDEIVWTA